MRTILYLGNTYCSSISQLKSIIEKSPAQDSPLGKELLCALKDGVLKNWLIEGDQEEQSLANKLPEIATSSSDSELLRKLGECFKSDYKAKTFNITDFITLQKVECKVGDNPLSCLPLEKASIDCTETSKVELSFCFTFKVEKNIGENVTLQLKINNKGTMLKGSQIKEFNLRELNNTLEVKISIPYVKESKYPTLQIEFISTFMGRDTILWNASLTSNKIINVHNTSFKMIYVEGGSFNMGEGHYKVEPVHKVTLDSFFIAETQVTQELWECIMHNNPSYRKGAQHPVEYVSWFDCRLFIEKLNSKTGLNFRLPTEAEWEFAAKGGNYSRGYLFCGSSTLSEVGWYVRNSNYHIHPVKQLLPNELGIYDMCGNVREWCHDAYNDYPDTHQKNPLQTYGKYRYNNHKIVRGGHYTAEINKCGPTSRGAQTNDYKGCETGFRLAMSIEKS